MEVFILMGNIDYEGSTILGVFSTYDLASSFREVDKAGPNGGYDSYSIESFTIDKV